MKKNTTNTQPWDFLAAYRGRLFDGEWPTLTEMFAISTERFAHRPCFTVYEPDRISLSYAQASARISAIARHLRARGISKGDKVAVTGKNSPEWAVAFLAVLKSGAIVVPIDYQLSEEEIANLIKASEARLVFIDEEKESLITPLLPPTVEGRFGLTRGQSSYLYDLADHDESELPPLLAAKENDLAAILFTSGTMGTPKGVMLSHKNFVSDCYLAQTHMPLFETDVFYALLPIHHSYTMLAVFMEGMSVGAEIVFGKRMVIKQILKDLREAKVTMFLGVPLLFNKILGGIQKGIQEKGPIVTALIGTLMTVSGFMKKTLGINPGKKLFHTVLDKASLASNRICISGGGPLAPVIFKKYNQLGIDFVQGYGLTETSPILTLNPVDRYKETSVGKLLPQVEAKLIDVDADGRGEIVIKGPMVMQGYYNMPEETKAVFTDDGWFRTGDVGWIDKEDYIYLTGRAKNMIVTEGGKNVYPEEIENAFQLCPEIDQIIVSAWVPDTSTRSEEIQARIYPSQEWLDSLPELKGHDWTKNPDDREVLIRQKIESIVNVINQKLHPYQRISRVTVLKEALEMTTTKKVKRRQAN